MVNNVSFNVKQGEIVGLLGPNGAGKTTSFYQVVGLIKPDEGQVFLNDINITRLPMYKRAKMGIGYLPQEASVFRKLSVEDNIMAVLEMTGLTKTKQKEKLESLLNEFNLQRVRKNNGDTLSGGERRRTEIARALAVDPKFILLDEPFAGVDPIAVEDIQAIVAKLKFRNIGILITDHNVNETLSICDRAYLLIDGSIFTQGTAEELAGNEQVRRLYLGKNFELKRKDYLHEEAAVNNESERNAGLGSNVENVLEKCIIETNRKIGMLDKIGVYKLNFSLTADLNMNELSRYVAEVKQSIRGRLNNDIDIERLLNRMPDISIEKYARSFRIYDNIIMPVFVSCFVGVGVLGILTIFSIYSPLFRELKEKLAETSAVFNEIHMLMHAKNN